MTDSKLGWSVPIAHGEMHWSSRMTDHKIRWSVHSRRVGRSRAIRFRCAQQLPPQMVDIESQNRVRENPAKFFEYARFPAFRKMLLHILIFGEKSVLVRDAQKIEHGDDHVQVRNQDDLRQ